MHPKHKVLKSFYTGTLVMEIDIKFKVLVQNIF